MLVQWVTRDRGSPVLAWGPSPAVQQRSAPATSVTYSKDTILAACGFSRTSNIPGYDVALGTTKDPQLFSVTKGWLSPGWVHTAVVTGVHPGQRIWYRPGDAAGGIDTTLRSFQLPTPGGDDEGPVHFLLSADVGTGENFDNALRPVAKKSVGAFAVTVGMSQYAAALPKPPAAVSVNGDISYSDGYLYDWWVWGCWRRVDAVTAADRRHRHRPTHRRAQAAICRPHPQPH